MPLIPSGIRRTRSVGEVGPLFITLDLPPSLTGSRGEYLRVVGIHNDG